MIEAKFIKKLGSFSLDADMNDSGFILLTGRNGAGKSTYLLCLTGQQPFDSGHLLINGKEVTGKPVRERRIAFVNQSTYFPHLDVDSHIMWAVHGSRDEISSRNVREKLAIDYSGKVGQLSLGQRIRVAIATAILASPEVLLIDEAVSNLSEKKEILLELKSISSERHFDIVYVSQDVDESSVANHHYVLEGGKMNKVF